MSNNELETALSTKQIMLDNNLFARLMPNKQRVQYILQTLHRHQLKVVQCISPEPNPIISETNIDAVFNKRSVAIKLNDVRKVDINGSDLKVSYTLTHELMVKLIKSVIE